MLKKKPKYQSGTLSAEDIYLRERAKQEARNQSAGMTIPQAEQMVLQSYSNPQQVFGDTAPAQNPQYLSEFTSNLVYAPTLSQYVGNEVPMKLALSNLDRMYKESNSDYANKGIKANDVLNPDLVYREAKEKDYNTRFQKIAQDPNLNNRQKYKETLKLRTEFDNDIALQRMYQNKANRDSFAENERKRKDITSVEAEKNIQRYDELYARQKGVGENYLNPYNSRNFAAIFDNEKFVNDALQGIEIDGQKQDISGGWYSNGMYFYKDKRTGERKEISAAKVYKALEGAISNNALLKARMQDEAELNTYNIDTEKYRQGFIQRSNQQLAQLQDRLSKAKDDETKAVLTQAINNLQANLQQVPNLGENELRSLAAEEYKSDYLDNIRDIASKKIKLETSEGRDQEIFTDTWGQWLGKRALAKADEAEERERINRENQVVPLQGATGEAVKLPDNLDEYEETKGYDWRKDAFSTVAGFIRDLEKKGKGDYSYTMSGDVITFRKDGVAVSKEENERLNKLYKEGMSMPDKKLTAIQKADNLAAKDNVFAEIYNYQLRNGKGTAKERANEAYKLWKKEKESYSFDNGIVPANQSQSENLIAMVKQGNLSGGTKEGLPVMTWLDKKASELGLKDKEGKPITTGQGLIDKLDGVTYNPYTKEVGINVRGVQLSIPATVNMQKEMQVLHDLKKSRDTNKEINTVWTLGDIQISGKAKTEYTNGVPNTVFIPNPQNQYEMQKLQEIQNMVRGYDLSKGIPLKIMDALYQKNNTTLGFRGTSKQYNSSTEQLNIQERINKYD